MGRSSWRYYTPFRDNPEAALQELRRRVFAEGDYSMGCGGFARVNEGGDDAPFAGGFPGNPVELLRSGAFGPIDAATGRLIRAAESGDFAGLSGEERVAAEQMRQMFTLFRGAGPGLRLHEPDTDDGDDEPGFPGDRAGSIEELLEEVAEDGTHSVLDILGTGPRREFGVAAPLPDRDAARVFGSDRPTREQVERGWMRLSERLERWQAYYVTVYQDGVPHEYAFIGCSGD